MLPVYNLILATSCLIFMIKRNRRISILLMDRDNNYHCIMYAKSKGFDSYLDMFMYRESVKEKIDCASCLIEVIDEEIKDFLRAEAKNTTGPLWENIVDHVFEGKQAVIIHITAKPSPASDGFEVNPSSSPKKEDRDI